MNLSVIIPGYNTHKLQWQRCVKSVLAAIGPEDEVILVDDCSKEPVTSTWLNIDDVRVRIIRLVPNQGQSVARNKAIEQAHGDYISFVDSDDVVMPDLYRRCFESLAKHPRDVLAFGARTVFLSDGLYRESQFDLPDDLGGALSIQQMKFLAEEKFLFDTVWSKLFRREFLRLNSIRFVPDICPGEDTMFVLECVFKGANWGNITGIGYIYYRYDDTSLSRYQPNYVATLKYWHARWSEYLNGVGCGYDGFLPTAGFSAGWLAWKQWDNIWMRGTPCSLKAKWNYLCEYREEMACNPVVTLLSKAVRMFVRHHIYIGPIRRAHLRNIWTDLKKLPCEEINYETR